MRKKILDITVLAAFAVTLAVSSNIKESACVPEKSVKAPDLSYWEAVETGAGVAFAISANSFTTESDEETGVEKKDVVIVAAPNDSENNTADVEAGQAGEASGESSGAVYENRWNISLTDEEVDLLAKIVWLEANGEPAEGQEAVVEVVFNRMASDLYPDTLYDVLSQNNPVQFVSWKNRDKAQPTEKEYDSIYNVLNGNTDLLRNDTMNFSTYPLTSNLDVKICCHYFCY